MPEKSENKKTYNLGNALKWSGENTFLTGVRAATTLTLAFFLLPEHFGLIGMARAALAIVCIFSDTGIDAALIQKDDNELTQEHWQGAF